MDTPCNTNEAAVTINDTTPPTNTDDVIDTETQHHQQADKKALSTSSATFVPKTQPQKEAVDKKALSTSSAPFVPSSVSVITTSKTSSKEEADKKELSVSSAAFVPKSRSQSVVDDKVPSSSSVLSSTTSFDPSWNNDPYLHQSGAENWEQGQVYDHEQMQMWEQQQWEQQQVWEQGQGWEQDWQHQSGHPMTMVTPEHGMMYMPVGYSHPMNMMQSNGMMVTPMVMPGHEMAMMGVPGPGYPSGQMGYPVMAYGTHITAPHPYTTSSAPTRPPLPPYPHPATTTSYPAGGRGSLAGSSNQQNTMRSDNYNLTYGTPMNRTNNPGTNNMGRGTPSAADFPQLSSSTTTTSTTSTSSSSSKPTDASWANKLKGAENHSNNSNYNNHNTHAMKGNSNGGAGAGVGPDWREKMWNNPAAPNNNNNNNNNNYYYYPKNNGIVDGNGTSGTTGDTNSTPKPSSSLPSTGSSTSSSSSSSSQTTTVSNQSNHHKSSSAPPTTTAKVIVCLNPLPKPTPSQSSSSAKTSGKSTTKSNKAPSASSTTTSSTVPSQPIPATDTGTSIPQEYLCSLTKQLMTDPVICADGETYEKVVIEKWIANLEKMNAKLISPVTGEEMDHPYLTPNFSIITLITAFLEK